MSTCSLRLPRLGQNQFAGNLSHQESFLCSLPPAYRPQGDRKKGNQGDEQAPHCRSEPGDRRGPLLSSVCSLHPPKAGPACLACGSIFLLQIPLLVTGALAKGEIQRKQSDPLTLLSGPEESQGYRI